jgi:hypothetical protein
MACAYCKELEEYLQYNVKNDTRRPDYEEPELSLTELYFKWLGFDSRWSIPVNFCPNCGKKLIMNNDLT